MSAASPLILGFDTSLMALSVAVVQGPEVLANRTVEGVRDHAERLPGLIDEMIDEAGKAFSDISRIAVTVGPGGFSGLRVGLAHARGMALVLGCPVIGIGTLEALVAGCRTEGPVIAAIDARRGELYIQTFDANRAPLNPPQALSPQAAAHEYTGDSATIVGTGRALLLDALPPEALATDGGTDFPDAADVARLAVGRLAGDGPPQPLYIRPPDAKLPAAVMNPG